MDISFDNKTQSIYREISHQVKRIQENAESVVPDTNDDIGTVASVKTSVMLKSKDITSRGVIVSGEAIAALMYITESEKSVSFLKLSKSFTIEYDIGELNADAVAQIKLYVINTETRVLNPRKVSVTFELAGELFCYTREELCIECALPAENADIVHAKYEHMEVTVCNAIKEKTFAANEQFAFPSGKPTPAQLVSQSAQFFVSETQLIGSKVIVKGSLSLTVCYLSNEVNYPLKAEFSTPFSQIVDIGEDKMDSCTALIELTSAYYDLIESINGDKVMDSEIHAVIQIVSRCKQTLLYISDAYSNLSETDCAIQCNLINNLSDVFRAKLGCDDRINIVEDCADVLSVYPMINQTTVTQGKIAVGVTLDIVYRTNSGLLSSVKRLINMETECEQLPTRMIDARLSDVYMRPDGAYMDCHITAEVCYQNCRSIELNRISSVTLNEESALNFSEYPAVSLVFAEDESLWELAKTYHSSVEVIESINDLNDGIKGKLLLIPKSV